MTTRKDLKNRVTLESSINNYFKNLQIDFLQLLKLQSFDYVWVIVGKFSGQIKSFPYHALNFTYKSMEFIFPILGICLIYSIKKALGDGKRTDYGQWREYNA